ncbi:MAG: AAA family ATPase [Alphaproteobacteria bacterium]|jgi:cellulose biosynthesis protein BcsQ|nr:AAA family ATPase [Alphaproteobacteria bacterium]
MAIIITLFNHKGGVGKTTLTYNLGYTLAKLGQKVLMIDADPQCNLTEFSIGIEKLEQDIISGVIKYTIYDFFLHDIRPSQQKNNDIHPEFYSVQNNLDLLAGSIDFAEMDSDIGLAISGLQALRYIPVAVYRKLQSVAKNYDYIFVDLSPALSPTNQLFLKMSDYFITPVFPGIFCLQALKNLEKIFKKWNRDLSSFELEGFKTVLPKYLGMVFQNYRPYTRNDEKDTKSAKRFNEDKERLNQEVINLASKLSGFDMAVDETEFKRLFEGKIPYTIAEIPDYNQLKMIAEDSKLPVIALDNKILNKNGISTPQYIEKRDEFITTHDNIANGLIKLKTVAN